MPKAIDDADQLIAGLADNRTRARAAARLISFIEDPTTDLARRVIQGLPSRPGAAHVVGITGPPGVGKSSLTNGLISEFRNRGCSVAVLAIDPTSPFSGGAFLGDRLRMGAHHQDANVFIRSMASHRSLGGLAPHVALAVPVLEAARFEIVILETVGVGQSEIDVASASDTTIVVLAAGSGDSIQVAKAGVLEIADVFVVNKAETAGSDELEAALRGMKRDARRSHLRNYSVPKWAVPIMRTVAITTDGVDRLADVIDQHRTHLATTGAGEEARRRRSGYCVTQLVRERVERRLREFGSSDVALSHPMDVTAVQGQDENFDPFEAADRLLAAFSLR